MAKTFQNDASKFEEEIINVTPNSTTWRNYVNEIKHQINIIVTYNEKFNRNRPVC